MYPINYPYHSMYSLPMMYGTTPMPGLGSQCYSCPLMLEYEKKGECEKDHHHHREWEDNEQSEVERAGAGGPSTGISTVLGKGTYSQYQSGMPMQPGMTMQPGITMQPGAAVPSILSDDTFSAVLKQIQIEAPQILSALIALGVSLNSLRMIIMRIIESANREQKEE